MMDLATLLIKVDASQAGDAAEDLDKLTASGVRAEAATQKFGKSTGKTASDVSRHAQTMKRDFVDVGNVLSKPSSPFVMPVTQGPKVAGAMRLVSTAAGALGGIMGGLVVTAGLAAAAALAELILKARGTGDEIGKLVEKMKEQARQAKLNREANDIFRRSLEGVEEALRKQDDALTALEQHGRKPAELALSHAFALAETARQARAAAVAVLELNEANLRNAQAVNFGAGGGAGAAAAQQIWQQRVDEARRLLTAAQSAHARAGRDIDRATRLRLQEIMETKPDFMKHKSARPKAAELQREIGAEFGLSDAIGIAHGLGGTVTSDLRSAERNKRVGGVASSFHLTGQAVDIAKGAGITLNKLVAAFRAKGARILEALDEGDHFHIAFKSMTAAQERVAREATQAAEQALNRQQAFHAENDNLDEEILRVRGQQVQGIDAQADLAIQQLQTEQRNYESALGRAVVDKKLEAADAQTLIAKRATLTFEQAKAVETQRQLMHMEQQSEITQRQLQHQIDDLRFADDMATTSAEQREIQLQLVDVTYQQREAALRDLKARLVLAGKLEEAVRVQAEIDRLPHQKAQDRSRTIRGTMNPLEQLAASIPQTEAEITEAFQRIQVNAFDGLTSAITNVIMGTRSLKDAFKDLARSIIADIIQMTIRMLIFRAIAGIFGGGMGGGAGATQGFIGPPSAKGNIFAGGNIVPFGSGGIVGGPTLFPMKGGRTGMMGEAGPEAIMPLARDPQGRLGIRAANNNAPIEVIVTVETSEDLLVKAAVVADARIQASEPRIVRNAAQATLRFASRPALMGRR